MIVGQIEVTTEGRAGLDYHDGARTAHFDGELLLGEPTFVVFRYSMIKWDSGEAITDEEREEIMRNITKCFTTQKGTVVFE